MDAPSYVYEPAQRRLSRVVAVGACAHTFKPVRRVPKVVREVVERYKDLKGGEVRFICFPDGVRIL